MRCRNTLPSNALMRYWFLPLLLFILGLVPSGQAQVLFNETFTGGASTTGFTINQISGDCGWAYDNPGGRDISGADFDADFAIFDSDNCPNALQEAYLTSAPFDASGGGTYELSFSQQYRFVGPATVYVEVWDGTAWNNAYTLPADDVGYPNPAVTHTIDITALTGGSAAAQVRFFYSGTWRWWWALDNISVTATLPVEYCASDFTSVCCEWVDGVSYAGISNPGPTGAVAGGPVDYTAMVANVTQGGTDQITVTVTADDFDGGNDYVYAFIDWDQNGTLDDEGEVYLVAGPTGITGPHSTDISVPVDAELGNTRMRVLIYWNDPDSPEPPDPCYAPLTGYGEAEDYTVNVSGGEPPAGYCEAGADGGEDNGGLGLDERIINVTFAGIDQDSPNAAPTAPAYSDYTSGTPGAVSVGNTYTIAIDVARGAGTPTSYSENQALVWIDWNQDGDFEDAGELAHESLVGSVDIYSGDITIPMDATLGATRMRIRLHDVHDGSGYFNEFNNTPCGLSSYGEVEDYTVNVSGPVEYCTTINFTDDVEPITLVQFAGIDQPSCDPVDCDGMLVDYTAGTPGEVVAGEDYTITVKGNTAGNFTTAITAFFDWDQDGTFETAVNVGTLFASTGLDAVEASTTVSVPPTALVGSTRMRVVKDFTSTGSPVYPSDPCGTYDYGQAEDYTVNVSLPVPPGPCDDATEIAACGSPIVTTIDAGSGAWNGEYNCVTGLPFNGMEYVYSFTPTESGNYSITINDVSLGGNFVDLFYVEGACTSTPANWNCLADVNAGGGTTAPFALNEGTQYHFLVKQEMTGAGSVTWTLNCAVEPPANDDCTGAEPEALAVGGDILLSGDNTGATEDVAPFTFVWEAFTLAECATVTVDYCVEGSEFNGAFMINVTSGCPDILTGLIEAPEGSYDACSVTFANLAAGTWYIPVLVDPSGGTPDGPYTIQVTAAACAPPYEPCASTPAVACNTSTSTGDITGAGAWIFPSCDDFADTPGQERIYVFTPPADGDYTITVNAVAGGWVDFFWKPQSLGCDENNWTCHGLVGIDATLPLTMAPIVGLTGGQPIYLMLDPEQVGATSVTFQIDCVLPECSDPNLYLDVTLTADGPLPTWRIREVGTDAVVANGGGGPGSADGPNQEGICAPEPGNYYLEMDGGSIGTTYVLRTTSDPSARVIDNVAPVASTHLVSEYNGAVTSNGTIQLPVAETRLIHGSCDKYWWTNNEYIVANEDPEVAAEWVPGGTNAQQDATTGYDFWFYDPNGGYSYIRQRRHNNSDGFGSTSSARTCHARVNGWSASVGPVIPPNVPLNVRVRAVVNGVPRNWGPACQFVLDPVMASCPPTTLISIPGHQFYSCGVIKQFTTHTNNRIFAQPVSGANQYEFQFRLAGGAEGDPWTITRSVSTYYLNLGWSAGTAAPLVAGSTYDVRIRARKGTDWCVYGGLCQVTISSGMAGGGQNSAVEQGDAVLGLWPNPNRGDQLYVSLTSVPEGVGTISMDLFDLSGKRVTARTLQVQDGYVNTVADLNGDLAAGVYMVQITAGDRTYIERLVIQP